MKETIPGIIEDARRAMLGRMANRFFGILLFVAWVSLLAGCHDQKSNEMSQADHRRAFFPSVSPESILDYQYYYRDPRGGYLTCARLTLNTNANLSFTQEGFTQNMSAQESEDRQVQQVFIDLLHASAASMVQGTNIPTWMHASKDVSFVYLDRRNQLGDHQIWWDTKQKMIYFTGIGRYKAWMTNR